MSLIFARRGSLIMLAAEPCQDVEVHGACSRKVMEAAAATLTPVVLELGGKDAFIVCEDVNLDQVN